MLIWAIFIVKNFLGRFICSYVKIVKILNIHDDLTHFTTKISIQN